MKTWNNIPDNIKFVKGVHGVMVFSRPHHEGAMISTYDGQPLFGKYQYFYVTKNRVISMIQAQHYSENGFKLYWEIYPISYDDSGNFDPKGNNEDIYYLSNMEEMELKTIQLLKEGHGFKIIKSQYDKMVSKTGILN